MNVFGPSTTVQEIMDEMALENQAMTMLAVSTDDGAPPAFVFVAAQAQFAEALASIVHMIGQQAESLGTGTHAQMRYYISEDGTIVPGEDHDG